MTRRPVARLLLAAATLAAAFVARSWAETPVPILPEAPASRPATPVTAPADVRRDFLRVIDRPRVDLDAREDRRPADDKGVVRADFSYASEKGQRVPGVLLAKAGALADGKRHPAVVVLHGTGGKKEGELPTLGEMAGRGFLAVSIDARFHGERGTPADYNGAIAKAFEDGEKGVEGHAHPLYYDTVWDVLRLVDYLQSRPDVDGKRIGLMGISKGGIECWLASAVDERITAAVPCISMQSFTWALEHDAWRPRVGTVQKGFDAAAKSAGVAKPDAAFTRRFYDRVIPGIYDRFDGPVMVTLIAPRPLLVINGETDDKNPLEGLKLCAASADAAYGAAGAKDRFRLLVEPATGHAVNADARKAAVDWFGRWLGDAPPASGG